VRRLECEADAQEPKEPKAGDAELRANLGVLLTKRLLVRNLFGEPNISDFEILIAFWLTARRHLPGEMGHIPGGRPLSYLATSPADLPRTARRRLFKGKTLRVSVDQCTFG